MAGADMNGSRLKQLVQREELVKEREVAVEKREDVLRVREEAVEKREEAVTMREKAVRGREGALQEKEKAMEKREKELSKREEAVKKHDKLTEPIRASAAGSSSPPRQPPPPGPATHIHQLPDEVLEKIFALLSTRSIFNVLSVCQRWRDLIEDRNLITKLKFEKEVFTTQEALTLIHSAQGLKSLDLFRRSDTVALLDAASARCTNIFHLSVEFCHSNIPFTDALITVFQSNPHIRDLCMICDNSLNYQFYQELGTMLPDLRKLEFNIVHLSDLDLHALIDGCSRNEMEEFKDILYPCSEEHIAKMVQFWGRSLRVLELPAGRLSDGALAQLAGCSELRQLILVWLSIPGDWLRGLAGLSHLEELNMSFTREVEPEKWCNFFSQSRSSPSLRKLSLIGRSGVDDSVLASVAAFCPQLEELEACSIRVTQSGLREVLRCCCNLHHLNVANTDTRVADIVPELPQLAPQLCRIRIGTGAINSLGEATLRRVQAQMPHLRIEWDTRTWIQVSTHQ